MQIVDHDYDAAAGEYHRRFGWPCTADGCAVWALAGQSFDALDVPAHLGPTVLSALRKETGCPQDVIEIPGEPAGSWRFLVLPQRHIRPALLAVLTARRATYLTNADRIELPPTRVPHGELRWVRPPLGRLAPLHTIVKAVTAQR